MKRRGLGVKMVVLLIFLTPVSKNQKTHWLTVGIGSILRLDNILILYSFSY